ncbi:MAG: hypothetical protein ACFFAS_17690 [Promethearchaeota archaeon]
MAELENLDLKSRYYIKDLIVLVKNEIGFDKTLSIILFGSLASKQNDNTGISDCDVLIIIRDDVPKKKLKNLEKFFCSLEIKHDFREYNNSFSKKIMDVVQRSTGMFVSHFVSIRSNWENALFHKIFNVNKVFSTLFAPTKIVLSSVIDNSLIIYGDDLRPIIKEMLNIPCTDMIKSIIMNLIITIFSIIITPLKNLNSPKYLLESIKWSLRASNYYLFKDSVSLYQIVNRFLMLEKPQSRNKAKKYYSKFLELRKNPRREIKFIFQTFFRILKIHRKAIFYKKSIILRDKASSID